jgi:16S rRNA processing protein RimM
MGEFSWACAPPGRMKITCAVAPAQAGAHCKSGEGWIPAFAGMTSHKGIFSGHVAQNVPDRFLAVARVVRPQGRRGEVLAEPLTDFSARLEELHDVFLENPGTAPQPIKVEDVWPHKGRVVIKFSGVDSISDAATLKGRHVLILAEDRMPLAPNQYYLWQLEGCRVVAERSGREVEVGTVTSVEPTGGVDVLHVATAQGEILIPLAQAICTKIDTEAGTILIDPPEDLLDLNA